MKSGPYCVMSHDSEYCCVGCAPNIPASSIPATVRGDTDPDFGPLQPTYKPTPQPDLTGTSPLPWRAGGKDHEALILDGKGQGVLYPGDIGGFLHDGDLERVIKAVNEHEDLTLALELAEKLLATYHEYQMQVITSNSEKLAEIRGLRRAALAIREGWNFGSASFFAKLIEQLAKDEEQRLVKKETKK